MILTQLNENPSLIYRCGLSPERLPDLIQHNSILATKALLIFSDSNRASE
jgi:hypothetical protein